MCRSIQSARHFFGQASGQFVSAWEFKEQYKIVILLTTRKTGRAQIEDLESTKSTTSETMSSTWRKNPRPCKGSVLNRKESKTLQTIRSLCRRGSPNLYQACKTDPKNLVHYRNMKMRFLAKVLLILV